MKIRNDGHIQLPNGSNHIYLGDVGVTSSQGIYWYNQNSNYAIHRTGHAWNANNGHAQLRISWQTGIVVAPGTFTTNHNKRKVDIQGRVEATSGTLTSDNRLKHNEVDLSGCLQTLSKLKPQKYLKSPFVHDGSFNYYGSNHHRKMRIEIRYASE